MKKTVLILAAFFCVMNVKTFAQCETNLPIQLQACFNSYSLSLTVTVSGSDAIIDGTLNSTAQITQMQACIDQYNIDRASCPGAPVIVMGNITSTVIGNVGNCNCAVDTGNSSSAKIVLPGEKK